MSVEVGAEATGHRRPLWRMKVQAGHGATRHDASPARGRSRPPASSNGGDVARSPVFLTGGSRMSGTSLRESVGTGHPRAVLPLLLGPAGHLARRRPCAGESYPVLTLVVPNDSWEPCHLSPTIRGASQRSRGNNYPFRTLKATRNPVTMPTVKRRRTRIRGVGYTLRVTGA